MTISGGHSIYSHGEVIFKMFYSKAHNNEVELYLERRGDDALSGPSLYIFQLTIFQKLY